MTKQTTKTIDGTPGLPAVVQSDETAVVAADSDGYSEFEVAVFRELDARGLNDEIALARDLADSMDGHGPEEICREERIIPNPQDRETIRRVADVICDFADEWGVSY